MKKRRIYIRKCGVCGKMLDQSEMYKDDGSDSGWVCAECFYFVHPEYDEFGEE